MVQVTLGELFGSLFFVAILGVVAGLYMAILQEKGESKLKQNRKR